MDGLPPWALHGTKLEEHAEATDDVKYCSVGSFVDSSFRASYTIALQDPLVASLLPFSIQGASKYSLKNVVTGIYVKKNVEIQEELLEAKKAFKIETD